MPLQWIHDNLVGLDFGDEDADEDAEDADVAHWG